MQEQTFYVTNSVPQVHNNFNSGIWQTLEAAIQSKAKRQTLYIVTGVAFAKEGETKTIEYTTAKDDTKQVPVPNYFYKVVLLPTTNSSGVVTDAQTVGFWFENKTYSGSAYASYAVSVDQIEQWTGFDFFPNLPDSVEGTAEASTANFL
jgi:endonuclease G